MRVRQVNKRHRGGNQVTYFLKHLTPRRGNEAVANASYINQIFAAIVANDERVKSVWPRQVPADHQLLPLIHAVFNPCARALSRLVEAVFTFPNDAFNLLSAHSRQHTGRSPLDLFNHPDST